MTRSGLRLAEDTSHTTTTTRTHDMNLKDRRHKARRELDLRREAAENELTKCQVALDKALVKVLSLNKLELALFNVIHLDAHKVTIIERLIDASGDPVKLNRSESRHAGELVKRGYAVKVGPGRYAADETFFTALFIADESGLAPQAGLPKGDNDAYDDIERRRDDAFKSIIRRLENLDDEVMVTLDSEDAKQHRVMVRSEPDRENAEILYDDGKTPPEMQGVFADETVAPEACKEDSDDG